MMKKTTVTFILSMLILSGCQQNKWDIRDPNLPASFYQTQEQLLNTAQENLKKTPNDSKAQFEVAYRLQTMGKLSDAISEYETVLKVSPTDFATLNNMAAIYEEMKDYSNAAKYVKKLYELNPDSSEVISDTVRILLENGEPEPAVKALENFIKVLKGTDGKNKAVQNDVALISELYQSIDIYKKQHAQK